MDVKRYLPQKTPIGNVMKESPEGYWVLSNDFDRILAERDALQLRLNAVEEENDRLRSAIPDGFVAVPKSMVLGKDAIGAINFHCGDSEDGSGMFGEYADGLLWVGSVFDDYGNEVHGLHLATAEYPEEGSTTLVEFPIQSLEKRP